MKNLNFHFLGMEIFDSMDLPKLKFRNEKEILSETLSDPWSSAWGGAFGGALSLTLTYPLGILVTHLQGQNPYEGVRKTVRTLWRERGFYRGLGPALVMNAYTQGVFYYLYTFFSSVWLDSEGGDSFRTNSRREDGGQKSWIFQFGVGLCAGLGCVLCTHSGWVVWTRMQTSTYLPKLKFRNEKEVFSETLSDPRKSFWKTGKEVYQEHGLRGFWVGLVPALLLTIHPAIQYLVLEQAKLGWLGYHHTQFQNSDPETPLVPLFFLASGSKIVAIFVTFPLLFFKLLLQLSPSGLSHEGWRKWISTRYAREGIRMFYRGLEFKILQSVLTSAFLITLHAQWSCVFS